jgi:hypothetical protein
VTVAVLLLVVAAVAFVLVTPDPTDDVSAILHVGKALHIPSLNLALVPGAALSTPALKHSSPIAVFKIRQNSLELLGSCRC